MSVDESQPDSRPDSSGEAAQRGGVACWLLLAAGFVFCALGLVGAFLPVLPTTPFLLLAGACFARSSPRFHRRLLENKLFGPYLREWQRDRTIPLKAKRKAYGLVVVSFGLSIALVQALWLRLMLLGIGLGLLVFLRSLRASGTEAGASRTKPTGPVDTGQQAMRADEVEELTEQR